MATLEMTMYVLGIRLDGTYTGHRVELEPMRSRQATGEVVSCAKALFRTSIDLTGYSSPQAAANGRWEEERDRFWGCLALVSTGETWIDVNGQATVDGQPCGLHHETDMSVEAPTLQELSQEMMFSSRVGMVAILQKMHLDLLDAHLAQCEGKLSVRQRAALRWYSKGCGEWNAFDRFIGQWLSFAFRYSGLVVARERDAVATCIRNELDVSSAALIRQAVDKHLAKLAASALVLKRGKTPCVSEQLAQRLSAGVSASDLDVLVAAADCGYALRNDLFHGGRDFTQPVDRQQLRAAEAVMRQINRYALSAAICGPGVHFPLVEQQSPPS